MLYVALQMFITCHLLLIRYGESCQGDHDLTLVTFLRERLSLKAIATIVNHLAERFKSLIFPCEASIWADNYWSQVHVATVHIRATLFPSLHARLSDNENYISGKSLHITKCYWVKSKSEFFHIVYESSCFCADKLLPAGGTFYDCAGGISSGVVLNCFPPFDLQFKLIVLSEKKYSFECCMKWAKGWALLRQRLDPGVILSKQHSGWSFHNPWSVKPISSSLFELRSILKDWESS